MTVGVFLNVMMDWKALIFLSIVVYVQAQRCGYDVYEPNEFRENATEITANEV
jgi:hypothetical protein